MHGITGWISNIGQLLNGCLYPHLEGFVQYNMPPFTGASWYFAVGAFNDLSA
ncbi:hypothetical protein SAMN05216388_103142 [Halorientalis persicus]|uniref:Uncharacterized protein n=1 Tax=Halorientalis persicus TaxID=1367881 RepID=A0A1H8UWN2_9EURY|nr:hypothetical protein SAMN05216388_103142 [Halorientalis persicus]